MKDHDQEKLWEAYLNEGIPTRGQRENDPYGSSDDEFLPGVDDELGTPPADPKGLDPYALSPAGDAEEYEALRAQGIPVTNKDPETGLWRYKPENDAEWEAAKAHQASLDELPPPPPEQHSISQDE